MEVINCLQGSDEWLDARLGKVTASNGGKFLTKTLRLQKSQAMESFLMDVVGEQLTRRANEVFVTRAMQWGTDYEPYARELYENLTETEVEEIGFALHDDYPLFGASPDGLIGDDGGLEIKCPWTAREHIRVIVDGFPPDPHYLQCLLNLWVTGRSWWDYVSYHPGLQMFRCRIEPTAGEMAKLEQSCLEFNERVEELYELVLAEVRQ